jgi:hypothetical protein
MQTNTATTPFGRRPMSLGMIASQVAAQNAPPDATVHKWHVFRDIKEARLALGATDRALAILDTKYKDVSQPSSQDISQVVAYAEAKGCERAALVYPKAPSGQAPFDVGRKRITPLVFDLEQDVPAAGEAFLTELMTMLGDGGGSSA